MMRAAVALGSNLGDRLANLQTARDRIRSLEGATLPVAQSAVYETSPIDCEAGAQNFYNAVIEIGFEKEAEAFFAELQEIERALGRKRDTPSPPASPTGRGGGKPRSSRESGLETTGEAPAQDRRKRNLSRMIDLDLLYFGSERREGVGLQLPHPRMTERKFVMQPLCDIAPDLRLPGQSKNVGELLAQLRGPGKIKRVAEAW
jgi:2-amino-4-hydroxy-6-hydroxymethyldihydropteridine diphosphokinase